VAQWRDREEQPLTPETLQALFNNDIACIRVKGFATAGSASWSRRGPRPTSSRCSTRINRSLARPEVVGRYAKEGSAIVTGSPAEFAAFLKQNRERWAKVITTGNIRAE